MRFLVLCLMLAAPAAYANAFVTLASTTSTENSGLYDFILPKFSQATGIDVRVVAVGTGQALRLAENGDADILIVHHRPSEEAFIDAGHGINRNDLMYNDFVVVGPRDDPAGISASMSIEEAFKAISEAEAPFVSRGDDSGTHKKESELWGLAQITPSSPWYLDVGRGMGGALNIAAARNAYILSDRATWLSFKNPQELSLLYQGVPPLFNPYGVILVNPERHRHVKVEAARALQNWLTGPDGQKAISEFRVNGTQLFFPIEK
ncbi:MAG: substrate-binding domain-containing protein [Pseudomonadota bacterium]